jgi:rod shape determining protein RodA
MRPISLPGPASALPEELTSLRRLSTVRWLLLLVALLLAAIGLATVHSASAELAIDYLPRQAVWVGVGLLLFLVVFSLDTQVLLNLAGPLYVLSLVLLVAVLVFGQVRGGAKSWLGFGGIGGQPSEFAKIATALVLARYLAAAGESHLRTRQIIPAIGLVALPMLLIAIEPDLGGAALFAPMLGGMLLVAGVRLRTLVASALLVAITAGALWTWGMKPYQRQRVMTFLNPGTDPLGAGYQIRQSKIAVGSGELTGKGYMQGTQSQLRFLPERHTDFIFAVLAEEWGFVGVVTVLMLYLLYIHNGARIAARARDRAGILLVVGLLSIFAFHVLYNCAMVVGLVPVTGVPLPFLSYGGSFTMVNFLALGIILGVDYRRYVNR